MTEIWVMDSEICDRCGALLDSFNICPACGYDGVDWDERDEEDAWDISAPRIQKGLGRLATTIREQSASGETEPGGFGGDIEE